MSSGHFAEDAPACHCCAQKIGCPVNLMKHIHLFALFACFLPPSVAFGGVGFSALPEESAQSSEPETGASSRADPVDPPSLPFDLGEYLLRFCTDDALRKLGRTDPRLAELILRCRGLGPNFVHRDARARGLYAIDRMILGSLVSSVAFAPNGTMMALATWSTGQPIEITMFDIATGAPIRAMTVTGLWFTPTWYPANLTFSHDGSRLAFALSNDHHVVVIDVADGHVTNLFENDGMSSVGLSPDSSRLLTTWVDGSLRIYDLASDTFRLLVGHTGAVVSVMFLPGGAHVVSASRDGTIRIWDEAAGAETRRMGPLPAGEVEGLAASPDGSQIAAMYADRTSRIWRTATGECVQVLRAPFRELKLFSQPTPPSLEFSPDGTRLALSEHNGPIELWNMQSRSEEPMVVLASSGGSIRFSPDGNHIASLSTLDRMAVTLRTVAPILYERERFPEPAYWYLRGGGIADASNSSGSPSTVGARSLAGQVRAAYALGAYELAYVIEGADERIESLAFSPTSKRLAVASATSIRIVNAATGAIYKMLPVSATPEREWNCTGAVTFSEGGMELVSSMEQGRITSFNWVSGERIRDFSGGAIGPRGYNSAVQLLHGGSNFLARSPSSCWLCEGQSGARTHMLQGCDGQVTFLAVSPDSNFTAARSPNGDVITIYNTASGSQVATLGLRFWRYWTTELREATAASFSKTDADGTKIAVAFRDLLGIWRAETGEFVRELRLPDEARGKVTALAFSPDGKLIVAGLRDNSIHVWDAETATKIGRYADAPDDESFIKRLVFSPDGKRLASASGTRVTVRSAVTP